MNTLADAVRRRRVFVLMLGGLFGACAPATSEQRLVLGDGSEIRLTLPGLTDQIESDDRAAYYLGSGTIVTVQALPLRSESERLDRTPASVAEAMVERVELGEREGALARRSCRIGVFLGECLDGWIRHDDRRFERSGMVVAVGDRVAWFDVAAVDRSGEDVREQARRVLANAVVVNASERETAR